MGLGDTVGLSLSRVFYRFKAKAFKCSNDLVLKL
jgi:hypothetical protein